MSNQLNQLDEILYHSLRPWLDSNKPNERFASLISKIKPVKLSFNELYAFDFHRPLNPKMEYYQKIIINETNRYCNSIVALINEDDNALRQKYWFDNTLKEVISLRLTDTINIIKEKFYFVEFINPRNVKFDGDPDKKTETYIMQLLKVAFVKIYLEIQEQFKHLSNDFPLTERDIYDRLLNQAFPENSFLKKNQSLSIESRIKIDIEPAIAIPAGVSKESFTYKNFDFETDKLTDLFKNLKQHNFISNDNSLGNFKRVFSGKAVSNPVVWSGNTNEFYYFVYLMHNQFALLEPLNRNLWKVACKCFIKFDGSQFDLKKLKEGVKPQFSFEQIEEAVEILK